MVKGFVIAFDSGVVAIRHWKMHNYIRSDRYKPTIYEAERAMLYVQENNVYALGIPNDNQVTYQLDTQDRIGKDSIEIGKVRRELSSSSEEEETAEADLSTIVYYMEVPVRQGDYLEFQQFADYLTKRYWNRKASDHDKQSVYEQVRKRTVLPSGEAVATMDTDKKALLERAFAISMDRGPQAMNWHYVFGVLARWERMELHTRIST